MIELINEIIENPNKASEMLNGQKVSYLQMLDLIKVMAERMNSAIEYLQDGTSNEYIIKVLKGEMS